MCLTMMSSLNLLFSVFSLRLRLEILLNAYFALLIISMRPLADVNHLPVLSDVERLPKLCTIRSTVGTFCLSKKQAIAFAILIAELLQFRNCLHKTTTNDNHLHMASQKMQIILADYFHKKCCNRLPWTGKIWQNQYDTSPAKVADLWSLSEQSFATATTGAAAIFLGAQSYNSNHKSEDLKLFHPRYVPDFSSLDFLLSMKCLCGEPQG